MTSIRPFVCTDLLKYNNVNLDPLTETYGLPFYLQYYVQSSEYFNTAIAPDHSIMAYIMGKAEGTGDDWHGHVTAVSVAAQYRRLGVAGRLMDNLEKVSKNKECFFVDLFVRVSNCAAINMYNNLGYVVYRDVLEYYSGDDDENAHDMRKALPRDTNKKSMIPFHRAVRPEEL